MSILDEILIKPDKIERVFHPVGQGAFYSERFFVSKCKFNIVYDCGTAYLSKQKEGVVKQSFLKDDVIDILFISHLDWDHISLIPTLFKSVKEIRHVVLPHVDTTPILLSVINDLRASIVLRDDLFKIMISPEEYFNGGTKVWRVSQFDKESPMDGISREVLYLDEPNQKEQLVSSGKKISLRGINFWCYIPFNYYEDTGFKDLLEDERISKSCLWKGLNENLDDDKVTIEKVLESLKKPEVIRNIIKSKSLKNRLKEIYNKLEGKVNGNSLVVYSGPLNSITNSRSSYYLFCNHGVPFKPIHEYHAYLSDTYRFDIKNRPACLFNGDSTYNESTLMRNFSSLWSNIGTIQVAHHGSKSSHDFKCNPSDFYFCPISHGDKNNYGHPSSLVLSDLISKNRLPIHVTGHNGSEFIQVIFFW